MNLDWQTFLNNIPTHTANSLTEIICENFWCDLSDYSVIAASGSDCEKFLQGQLTCDICEINEHQSRLTALCNHKGRILALFRILKWRDIYYLILPTELSTQTIAHLKKYILFSKVKLEDVSNEMIHIGCSGEMLDQTLIKLGYVLPQQIDEVANNNELAIIRIPGINSRYEILGDLPATKNLCEAIAKEITFTNQHAWQLANIKAGIAIINSQTTEKFTPHMINLPKLNGVSFNKGCYVGQEIIARTQYLGRNKKQLCHASINTTEIPKAGDSLLDESNQEVGTIVDACQVQKNNFELLVVINEEAIAEKILYWKTKNNKLIV